MSARGTGARVRATAARVVDAVASHGRSLDAALEAEQGSVPEDGQSHLRLFAYGSLRHHWQLSDWIDGLVRKPLKKRDSVIHALLAVGLYQLALTRIPDHAAVSQTVEAARILRRPKFATMINAILRRFIRDRIVARTPSNEQAVYNHPQWLIDVLRRDWPDDWQDVLASNNARAPMWLRVNAAAVGRAVYLADLEAAGMEADTVPGFEQAIRLAAPCSVQALPGFDAGRVSVQDAAAQLAAPWLLAGVSGRLLDACAAPGGKSGHLLELGGAAVTLTCIDIDPKRLDAVRRNHARLGVTATLARGDASKPEGWWDRAPFDGILVDAPCSATGVIRRHPDIKLLRRAADVAALTTTQAAMLDALWTLLKPGGRLLYVTCSVLAAENDELVSAFLARTPGAQENDVLPNNNIRDVMRRKACGFQILPGTAHMDGFYFACLEKVS